MSHQLSHEIAFTTSLSECNVVYLYVRFNNCYCVVLQEVEYVHITSTIMLRVGVRNVLTKVSHELQCLLIINNEMGSKGFNLLHSRSSVN